MEARLDVLLTVWYGVILLLYISLGREGGEEERVGGRGRGWVAGGGNVKSWFFLVVHWEWDIQTDTHNHSHRLTSVNSPSGG